jgi:hypothetical protein
MKTKVTENINEEITLGGGCFWCLDAMKTIIRIITAEIRSRVIVGLSSILNWKNLEKPSAII